MEKLIHILAICILLNALTVGFVNAQTWTSTSGPLRPHVVKDLSSAVSSGQTLYAADAETLKVSKDGGSAWKTTTMPVTNPLAVAAQSNNPNKVQVARLGHLESSTDGGANWNWAALYNVDLVPLRIVMSLADTSMTILGADTVLRAVWTTSLYRSTDAGLNWSADAFFKDSAHTNVNDVVFHTHTPSYQKVWVGGSRRPMGQSPEMTDESGYSIHQKGVWYSSNNGAAWTFRGGFGSGTDRNVTALAFSTISGQAWSELLLAATSSLSGSTLKATLFQSTNGGSNWGTTVDLYNMLQVGLVRSIAVCWNDSNKMVAATDKGFAVSYNRGSNWTLRNTGISDAQTCYRVVYDRALDSTVWLCTDGALYKSTNSGSTWSSASSVFGTMNVSGSSFSGGAAQAVSSSFSAIARQSGGSWVYPPRNVGLQ